MKKHSSLLQHHALLLIDNSRNQTNHLSKPKNPEALHDFRVSIRRLRSFLKAYQEVLNKSSKKTRDHLGKVMQSTNHGRDAEVHITWLSTQKIKASEELKLGIELMLQSFADAPTLDIKKVQKQTAKALDKLEYSFKHLRFKEGFNALTAQILSDYAKTLKTELSQLAKDPSILHQTRITGKRLRYILELIDSKESQALVKQLKTLQDTLGEINDLQLLSEKLESRLHVEATHWSHIFVTSSKDLNSKEKDLPELKQVFALATLYKYVLKSLENDKEALKNSWLGRASTPFFKDLNSFVKTLSKTADDPISES